MLRLIDKIKAEISGRLVILVIVGIKLLIYDSNLDRVVRLITQSILHTENDRLSAGQALTFFD
jgi:hypothetical protein